jgi:hypothetical protein
VALLAVSGLTKKFDGFTAVSNEVYLGAEAA